MHEENLEEDIRNVSVDEATPLTDWATPPTIEDLTNDLTEVKASHEIHKTNVTHWLDHLNNTGSAKIKAVKGRSNIHPKVIRKQAEWRYSSLSEPFLSTQDMFDTAPVTHEDKKAAEQNGLILNSQFTNDIDKVRFIDEYVRTAVDEGSVVVRVGWESIFEEVTRKVPTYEYVQDISEPTIQLNQLTAQLYENNRTEYDRLPEHIKQALRLADSTGMPHKAVKTGSEDITEEKLTVNRPTIEVCDYANIMIDPSCKGDLDQANFIIFSYDTSLSELERDGSFSNLDDINVEGNTPVTDISHSESSTMEFTDKPRKQIVAYEYWGYWDINDTGLVEPIVVTWVGNTIIKMERNVYPDGKLPFVLVQYLPVRKEVYGEPDGELLIENQKIIGATTRGMVDIMARGSNGQVAYRKDALDFANKRKFNNGENYEFNGHVDPKQAFHMHTFAEIPQSAYSMVQLQNQDAESLTGVKAFSSGVNGNSLGDSATGIRSATDATSKREAGILNRLASGIVKIGRKIVGMNAVNLSEEEVIRVTNDEFETIKRDDLAGKIDIKLSISTAEADEQKASELSFMLQTMGNNMDPEMSKLLLTDIAKLRKMPELAKKLEVFEPKPDPLAERERLANIMLIESQVMLNQAKAQESQAKAGNTVSDTDLKNLNYVEQETGVKQEREKELHGAQADANMELEVVKSQLAPKKDKPTNQA